MVYRGKVHHGEHEPIVDRPLFEAVQAKFAAGAASRHLRFRASPAILAGRLYDDRGNRMTPTHANKHGVRYRYYVSHALLQKRRNEAGTVPRVPAPDIERIVIAALRELPDQDDGGPPLSERDLVERRVERIVVRKGAIEVQLRGEPDSEVHPGRPVSDDSSPKVLTIPWSTTPAEVAKGILHSPSPNRSMDPKTRDALLTAIAKARLWIQDLVKGRVASFAEIAEREGKVERHVRFLAPLAFVSPRIVTAIIDGSAPADLTVSALATTLPYLWREQERQHGFLHTDSDEGLSDPSPKRQTREP